MARGVTDRLFHRHRQRHTARAIDRASERRRSARVPVVRGGTETVPMRAMRGDDVRMRARDARCA
jgi:hypothetical protein